MADGTFPPATVTPPPQAFAAERPNPGEGPDDRPTVYLHPGHIHVATGRCAIKTILGSCIAVCVWEAQAQVGGVVHYLLPQGMDPQASKGRYGNLAIPALVKAVQALSGAQNGLRAKVFGGAGVLVAMGERANDLGSSNAKIAWQLLAAEKVPVIASDVGGNRGRRLLFNVDDGAAWVWKL
jgi:chemotaxis protein CheD